MAAISTSELSLVESTPNPVPAEAPARRSVPQTNASFKHCAAAYRRAYKASLEGTEETDVDKVFAAFDAGVAYCDAMPLLSGYESIRDFIACAAHGILIGAILPAKGNQLIAAARVALATYRHEPK